MFFTHPTVSFRAGVIFLMAGGLLAACEREQDPEAISPSMAVYFESVGQGQSAAFTDTMEVVVRDSVAWARLEGQLDTVLPIERIDFSTTMALLAAVPTPMGGTNILFESVEDDGASLIATYSIGMPGRDCRVIDGHAVPFQVVIVPRSDAPVRFEHGAELYPCTLR